MTGKVLDITDYVEEDTLGCYIARQYMEWENLREPKLREWQEIQQYLYATDTTKTANSSLPWSNKTTIPKLCQIKDNLFANYMATLFPKRKWLEWEGDTESEEAPKKRKTVKAYMEWCTDRNSFYEEAEKLIIDYIEYGNVFVMPEWIDGRNITEDNQQVGYVGPGLRRISPLDIVFNPTAPSFQSSPKIIRSLMTIGEVKEMVERLSKEEESSEYEELFDYMMNLRDKMSKVPSETINYKDNAYNVSGFGNFQDYLRSDYVEVLTFYGDIFLREENRFERNQIIKVIDRHKVLSHKTNPSYFGHAPIYHAGWRVRPDNLWAMGPLDNLVGMQYRIDHLENMKADVWDITRFPVFKIKGYVEDFVWQPGERIIIGDDGDVELMSIDAAVLQANTEIAVLEAKMEEMAGSPKEAMGFRTPGEKTAYEVQRLENAASRIFVNKTAQFERRVVEPAYNGMLELARRNMDKTTIRVWDDQNKYADFLELTREDITGQGRIIPVGARHFAEHAELVQNLTNFYSSAPGQDPLMRSHFSTINMARMFERVLGLEDYKLVEPYVRLSEEADAKRQSNVHDENVNVEAQTPSGVIPGDFA